MSGHVLAPDLSIRQEEPLLWREAIDRLYRSGANDLGQRHVCQFQAAVVGGVLAQRELAIELHFTLVVFYGDEARIFVCRAVGPLLKLLVILRRPPVAEVALRVVLAPLVVESVGK